MLRFGWLLALLVAGGVRQAAGSVTVLVGEPFGRWGTIMPVGHISIFLDRVCSDGPVKLRMCRPGEPQGVVLGRLDKIGELDWIDSPVSTFLYGTDRVDEVMPYGTKEGVEALREEYRRANMEGLFPDGTENLKRNREWWETVGVLYSRKEWGYELATTRAQDEAFVARMNADANRHAYTLKNNCADFAANAVNFYYPGAVTVNKGADFGYMTPKQVAKCVWMYGRTHPEAGLRMYEMPQLPGELRRSRPVRGTFEMILATKRYLATMLVIQPELVAAMWVTYLHCGRWSMDQGAEAVGPEAFLGGGQAVVVAGAQ